MGVTAQSHLLAHKNGIHHISTRSHIAPSRNGRTFSGAPQRGPTSCLQHRDLFQMGRTSVCTPTWIALLLHIARAIPWPAKVYTAVCTKDYLTISSVNSPGWWKEGNCTISSSFTAKAATDSCSAASTGRAAPAGAANGQQ